MSLDEIRDLTAVAFLFYKWPRQPDLEHSAILNFVPQAEIPPPQVRNGPIFTNRLVYIFKNTINKGKDKDENL